MPPSAIAVAILNARPTTLGLAVLDAKLNQQDDGWYQLLPVGPFKARDAIAATEVQYPVKDEVGVTTEPPADPVTEGA